MSNIYLIGMMGSGKSVTGKKLAALMNLKFVDLDEMLEEKNHSTIADIFSSKGEPAFRDLETAVLKEVSVQKSQVIATGGGVILRPENIRTMRQTGEVVYLETSFEDLWRRVEGKKGRPLLNGGNPKDNLSRIYDERQPLYEQICDFRVNTDGRTAESVANEILSALEKKP